MSKRLYYNSPMDMPNGGTHNLQQSPNMTGEHSDTNFVLTDTDELSIYRPAGHADLPRWQPVPHLGRVRPCMIMTAGEVWTMKLEGQNSETMLFASFARGLPKISDDGLVLEIQVITQRGSYDLARLTVTNLEEPALREVSLDLGHVPPGSHEYSLSISAGPQGNPTGDWLAVSELVIGQRQEIPLLRARAFHETRVRNEIAHFENVYDHKLFNERNRQARQTTALRHAAAQERLPIVPPPDIAYVPPEPGEDVYHFAHRLLGMALRSKAPNFHQRLADLASSGPLDVVSFCAGAAQIEASLIRSTDKAVSLTLVDINQHLLDQAASAMPSNCDVTTIAQDVNTVSLAPERYDIAIFVSGVHHIVELEHLWRSVHRSLRPGGELWLIGEQVGPNGNRLDANCIAKANDLFRSLPKKLRRNNLTGKIDTELANNDCAEATFEGIRSEDIEATLARHFLPIHVYKRNCFLWRLVNQTYFNNYDLSNSEDVDFVRSIVTREVDYFLGGGRPTELHGVYRAIG